MEDFVIPKGYSIDLNVKKDDYELIEVSKKFITELKNEYKKYKDKLKKEENNFLIYKKNKNVYFSQEKLLKKSPLTILNGGWGSGKTYFIEKFAKNFLKKEIEIEPFKNIIILDTWKYSNSTNIQDEIIAKLFYILLKMYDKNNKKELYKKLGKFAIEIFNATALSWINYFTKFNFKNLSNNQKNNENFEKLVNEISKDIKPTLVIFDNIERIGIYSWEIIKAIFKISQIDNFCFVLPMNIKKLSENEKSNEYPIEKYIDLSMFNLKQDYLSFLKNYKIKDEEAIIINNILNHEIKDEKLSIREVEQRFIKNNIFSEKNHFLKINKIVNEIWNSKEKAREELKKNKEIDNFIYSLIDLREIFVEFRKNFIEGKKIYGNTNENLILFLNLLLNNNWSEADNYTIWSEKFNKILIEIKNCNNEILTELKEKEKKLKQKQESVKETEIKIKEIREKINIENKKGSLLKNEKEILKYQKEIKKENLKINKNTINDFIREVEKIYKIYNIALKFYENLNYINDRYKMIINDINKETDDYLKSKYLNSKEKKDISFSNFENTKEQFINELLN